MVSKGNRTAAAAARLFQDPSRHCVAVVSTGAAFQDGLCQIALKKLSK